MYTCICIAISLNEPIEWLLQEDRLGALSLGSLVKILRGSLVDLGDFALCTCTI